VKNSFLPLTLTILSLAAAASLAQSPTPADIFLSEDFDTTPLGQIPKGFTRQGAVGVAEDAAHSGKRSLRIEPATKGGRFITLASPAAAAVGGEHWGRFYLKVKLPAPTPIVPEGKTSGIIHSTLVSGKATSPLANDPIEVRMAGTITMMTSGFKWLYNVQPKARKEFGVTSKAKSEYTDQWTLVEWHVANATQTYQFFVNGQEVTDIGIHKGAGQFEGAEIPAAFASLSFGWTNYQPASGEGFTAWIDDLVLSKKRVGGGPVPTTAGVRK
jgi:hypothetical protein